MHGLVRSSLRAVLLLCLGSSCGPSPEADTQPPFNVRITNVTEGESIRGSHSLQASAEDDSGRVARMEFRIARTLLCTDITTRGSGARFGCTWDSGNTPEGDYELVATAYDAAGNAATSEPVSFNVPPNQKPTIASVKATPETLDEGASTTLVVDAQDLDEDKLTYSWTQTPATPVGKFSDITGANPKWTAPPLTSDMTFTLQVTVSDVKGGQAQSSVEVPVKNLPENHPPTISSVTSTTDPLGEGESTTLVVDAQDLDEDTLTYSWTQTPATPVGKFSDSTAASPTWTAPELTSTMTFTFQVTVSDGKGSTAQGSVEVSVANHNHPPDVTAITAAPATVLAGATVNLSITASDVDGDKPTYEWKTIPSGAGLFFSGETTSTPKWRSGDISAETPVKLQVTVSDGMASVTREVDVRVTVPTYAQVQQVWDATCTTTCHNASSASGGLNLAAGSSYAALVDIPGTSSACASYDRVTPGLPNVSLLVQKVSGTTCGTRMPMSDSTYFDKNPGLLTRIRSWILAGAPKD
jgi:hypothetical protein